MITFREIPMKIYNVKIVKMGLIGLSGYLFYLALSESIIVINGKMRSFESYIEFLLLVLNIINCIAMKRIHPRCHKKLNYG